MKILIIGDNLGGGGSLLGSAILDEIQACCYPNFEFTFWFSRFVSIPPNLERMNVAPRIRFLRLAPRWLSRALLVRSQKDVDIVLNLTNFPIGKLGVVFKKKSYKEICLFHNAYFFSLPKKNRGDLSLYFLFREIFMRRLVLNFLYKLFRSDNLMVVVQSSVMKKLSANFFKGLNVRVSSIHKPPMVSYPSKSFNSLDIPDISDFWFYPASGEPHKNHLLLISLCKEAITKGLKPKVLVTLDEKSRYGARILRNIKINNLEDSIVNIGWVSNDHKFKIYGQCRGIIFLSCFESLGIPLIEARHLNVDLLCVQSEIADEVLGIHYPKFDLSKSDDREKFMEILCNLFPLNCRHQNALSDGVLQSYLINFIN